MKKSNLCFLLAAVLLLSACSFSKSNNVSSTVGDASQNDVSQAEYAPSEKTEYQDDTGSDVIYAIVSGNDVITNPWADVDDVDDEGIRRSFTNSYENISVPTWFAKYDGLYFVVDCYHNQIIYNDNLEDPIIEWKVMDKLLNKPHTIAFDGEVYMVDDTDNNKIVAYKKVVNDDGSIYFDRVQEFVDMGEEPHYVVYREETGRFYAWSSKSGQLWVFKRSKDSQMVFLDESYSIPALKDVYVRSFTFCDGKAYFVSGTNGSCTIFETTDDDFNVLREIPVAPEIGGMVQLTKIQDYYYVTVSTSLFGEVEFRNIVRTDSLEHLLYNQYESVYDTLVTQEFPGTPYNISYVDGEWCLTVHRTGLGAPIVHFEVENNEIVNVGTYY